MFIGDAVLMFLAFAGVATLIKTTPVLFNIVRYLGAIYLLWMGAKMLYAVLTQRDGHSSADSEPGSAILKRSLTLSLTNPKAILFMSHSSCSLLTSAPKRPDWRSLSWR